MFNFHKTFQNDINNFTNDEILKKNEKEYKDLTNAIIEIFLLEKKSEEQISKMYRYKKFGDVHAIIKEYLAKRFSFCFARYGINRDPAVTQIREEEFIGEAFDCRKEKHLLEKNYINSLEFERIKKENECWKTLIDEAQLSQRKLEQEHKILKEKLEKIRIAIITHDECPSIACPEYDECCAKGRKYDEELLQIIEE